MCCRRDSSCWVLLYPCSRLSEVHQLLQSLFSRFPQVLDAQTVAEEVAVTLAQPQRVREALPDLLTRYPECWYFVAPRVRPVLSRLLGELGPAVQARVRLIDLAEERQTPESGALCAVGTLWWRSLGWQRVLFSLE